MIRHDRAGLLALCCLTAGATVLRAQTPAGPRYLPPESPPGAGSTAAVRTASGLVRGTVATSGVRTFRGLPYAAPPVGDLRWREPQPVAAWKGVRAATRFGPRCMQLPVFADMVFRSDGMSEDCLYLNVWAPARKAGGRAPVLLYFYGGGFVAGDGSEPRYDGGSLARRGIVVVTANYRLGVFGFLAHPALTAESPHHASGDYGLLDQVAALAWVRRNIAAFGGNPARITIAGESAGSISVCALMASPLSRRLIAGAIGESGGMIRPTLPPLLLADAEQRGAAFADSVGARSLAALRATAAESLLAATGRPGNRRFAATIDGYFLPAAPADVFAGGRQARVPLLVGWNTEEAGWRALLGEAEPTPGNYEAALRRLFGARADEALALFPASTAGQVEANGMLLAGAAFIGYSTWKWAELQRGTRQPVYRYLYAHPRPAVRDTIRNPPHPGAVIPESAMRAAQPTPPSSDASSSGAVHSAEIEYALGNLATNDVYGWTPDDDALSAVMQAYVANFVRTGNPNGTGLPAWPAAFAGDTARHMVLDVPPHAEAAPHEDVYRFLDRFYAQPPQR